MKRRIRFVFEINGYWKCDCEVCEQLFVLIKSDAADIGPIHQICYVCNSYYGFKADKAHLFDLLKENKDDIVLLTKEQALLDQLICDELRKKSQNKIRMTPEQICKFKQYCDLKTMAQRELNVFFTVLHFQRLTGKIRRLIDNSCLYEFAMQIGSYIHEQEFVKAYLRFVNDCSRKTWSAIYC